jgi:hypothetical protein
MEVPTHPPKCPAALTQEGEMRPFIPGGIAVAALLATWAPEALADERRVGAWSVGVLDGKAGAFAATANDSGAVLGQYCYAEEGNCVWVLVNEIGCEAGHRYPLLVSTDSGAAILELLCMSNEGRQRFVFTNFDAIDWIVRKARTVGMAFPTANGLFHVSSFSLEGATRAVTLMRGEAETMAGHSGGAVAGFSF